MCNWVPNICKLHIFFIKPLRCFEKTCYFFHIFCKNTSNHKIYSRGVALFYIPNSHSWTYFHPQCTVEVWSYVEDMRPNSTRACNCLLTHIPWAWDRMNLIVGWAHGPPIIQQAIAHKHPHNLEKVVVCQINQVR